MTRRRSRPSRACLPDRRQAKYTVDTKESSVDSVTLSPERTAFIDLGEVQPRVRAKQAYALAAEFAARTGNVVDPGVVAIIP